MKNRVTFEVDTVVLFDALHALKTSAEQSPLGDRLVAVLIGSDEDIGFFEELGLAYYGVKIVDVSRGEKT